MKERKYVIYAHINKANRKAYIGQTCQTLQRRWRDGKGYTSNEYFTNAIKEYGWDGFEHIVLKENLTKSEADFYEKLYIKEFKSDERQYGYNLTLGGEGMIPSEETREKMRLHHADFRGEKSPMYGKNIKDFMTPEAYNCWLSKIREYSKAHRGGNHASAKKIYCYEKDKVYDSVVEAAEECNISVGDISACVNKKKISAGYDQERKVFLHWCRAEEKDSYEPPPQEKSLQQGEYHFRANKIYCFELDEVFYGTGEVQRKYNINTCHLIDCLHGKRHSCGKHPVTGKLLHWCYYDDKDDFIIPEEEKSKNLGKYHHAAKAVYCIELNEQFDTAVEANKKYGFSKSHISAVCRGQRNTCGKHPETKENLHWLFLNDAIEQGYVATL